VKILVLLLALFLLSVVPALLMACAGDGVTAEHMPPISGDMTDGHPQSFPYGAERLPISIAGSGGGHVPDGLIPASAYFEDGDAIDWGPTLVIWGCIIVFTFGVILAIYLRIMAWIRKWG
jgi:hypothetical protein